MKKLVKKFIPGSVIHIVKLKLKHLFRSRSRIFALEQRCQALERENELLRHKIDGIALMYEFWETRVDHIYANLIKYTSQPDENRSVLQRISFDPVSDKIYSFAGREKGGKLGVKDETR
jgi:hypothetical protein